MAFYTISNYANEKQKLFAINLGRCSVKKKKTLAFYYENLVACPWVGLNWTQKCRCRTRRQNYRINVYFTVCMWVVDYL